MQRFPAATGSDGVLWQVQTTFLSVGFAGLAVAAQLFAETPLAVGASRGRVLSHVRAGLFVAVGLAGNLSIAIESIWLSSNAGVVLVSALWFVPTVALLIYSTFRLMQLFGNPSQLDQVVRSSLVGALASRLERASRTYAEARQALAPMYSAGILATGLSSTSPPIRVPVPQAGMVVRAIRPQAVRRAFAMLSPTATGAGASGSGVGEDDFYAPPEITLAVELGDRTRLGDTAFMVGTSLALSDESKGELVAELQSAIQFGPEGTVTPDEETDLEISNLKDVVSVSLRSGAFGTAERALELLGRLVREVWTAHLENLDSSRRSSFTRRDWLFWSVGETEQDVTHSARAAQIFVGQAMTRALEAPRTGSAEYVDECLRSFTRIWSELLGKSPSEFDAQASRIVTCVQNLAAYSYSSLEEPDRLPARATWAMVELVKLAIDAKQVRFALAAARELSDLFKYIDRPGNGRAHVRAGQLVLSGWLLYLAEKQDPRNPSSAELQSELAPQGTWPDILDARRRAERGEAPFSRWDWWETNSHDSGRVHTLELSHFIDQAELAALANSYGRFPPASDQATASEYERFLRLLTERADELTPREQIVREGLAEAVEIWRASENGRLALQPLSDLRLSQLNDSIRKTLDSEGRLATEIPMVSDLPESVEASLPILGMNFRVPRHYLVEEIFNQTYTDPEELGRIIGRGFIEGEERRILEALRSGPSTRLEPSVAAMRERIDRLADDARQFVLVTPYGGLFNLEEWYTASFRETLSGITHIQVSGLEDEAILFERRSLLSCRRPEEKEALAPVSGTSLAIGVFDGVEDDPAKEPQVRIETGEFFAVWRVETGRVFWFGNPTQSEVGSDSHYSK